MRANSDWLTRHSECLEQLTAWTSDALIVTDRDMRLRAWNRGAELMSGWDRAEVLGCEPPFFPPGARDLAVERWRWVVEHGDTIANFEIQPVTKDGRRVSLVATLSPVIGPGADVVGVVAIAKEISLLKALQAQQRSQARLEERELIAMDLHDKTIQTLHGAVFHLTAAEREAGHDSERLLKAIRHVGNDLRTALQELRGYVLTLSPDDTLVGRLSTGLAVLAERVRIDSGLRVEVSIDDRADLLVERQIVLDQLLTIAGEAMMNAVRHAQATQLCVQLEFQANQPYGLTLRVEDDGHGFEMRYGLAGRGHGLKNMARRAQWIGAHLSVTSQPGRGTEVRVDFGDGPEH